jgi:hypothetical protein
MHMLLFDILPLHNDALLVPFNELLHPFEKGAFQLPTKPRLHRLLTSPCQPNHYTCYRESSVFSDQGIHPLDVLVRYTCSSLLKAIYPLVDLSLMHGACSILCQNPEISADITPSAHRRLTTARCSSKVQSLSGAVMLLPS